ncbi:MAG: DUF4430 domain-containing protein, partial [Actinobacteria bacterium]
MEVRKNKLKSGSWILDLGSWRKKKSFLIGVSSWLLVFCLLAQPVLATTVFVRIEGPTKQIFQGTVNSKNTNIQGVPIAENIAASAIEAAAKKGNFSTDWSSALFLNSIAGINSDPSSYSYWNYRHNYSAEWPKVQGLGVQKIKDGDNLLFFYTNVWPYPQPIILETSKSNVKVGKEFSLTTKFFDDSAQIIKSISTTVKIGNQTLSTDANGNLTTSISETGTHVIYAEGQGFIRSNRVNVLIGQVVSSSQLNQAIGNSIRYLRRRQSKNGRIENPAVSAWAAIAFASANVNPNSVMKRKRIPRKKRRSLMDYLKRYSRKYLNRKWLRKHKKVARPLATDYARQIMAIYAAGHNPRKFAGINHIKEISRFFIKNQFGSKALLNDDIFTIIAYRASRVSSKNYKYRKAIEFVLKNQKNDGGFSYSTNPRSTSDIDTTAAAIQALVIARKSGVKTLDGSIQSAYDYLVSKQNKDGGFPYSSQFTNSSSQSTSWATQAITSWKGAQALDGLTTSSGSNPISYLSQLQQSDGGFGYAINNASTA